MQQYQQKKLILICFIMLLDALYYSRNWKLLFNYNKLNEKNYENVNFNGEDSDFYYVYAYTPTGVVCLLSAAVYYNLSTYRPDAIDGAVSKKKNVSTLSDWPTFNLY